MNQAQRWIDFGHYLVEQRERLGLRRREAAKRAKTTEHEWRALEIGYRDEYGGVRVLPNPSAELLDRIAAVLEVPVDELVRRIGPRPEILGSPGTDGAHDVEVTVLARRIARLRADDRRLVAALLDRLLRDG